MSAHSVAPGAGAELPGRAELDAAAQSALARIEERFEAARSARSERAQRRRRRHWPSRDSVLHNLGDAFVLPITR